MPTQKLTAEILTAAIEGFETQKRRIDAQIAELRQMLDGSRPEPVATSEVPKRKRRLSAAGRKAIAEAARKRWAAIKAAKEPQKPAPAKRTVSKVAVATKAPKKAVKKAPAKVAKKTVAKSPQKKAAKSPEAAPAVAAG